MPAASGHQVRCARSIHAIFSWSSIRPVMKSLVPASLKSLAKALMFSRRKMMMLSWSASSSLMKPWLSFFSPDFSGQPGQGQKFLQGCGRVMAQLADALGHAVHEFVQLLVLRFKKQVHGMEIRAFNVPMRLAGFGVENEFVGQQTGQLLRHRLAVFVGDANVCIHEVFPFQCVKRNACRRKLFAGQGNQTPCWLL